MARWATLANTQKTGAPCGLQGGARLGARLAAVSGHVGVKMHVVQSLYFVELHEHPGLQRGAAVFGKNDIIGDVGARVVGVSGLRVGEKENVAQFVRGRDGGKVGERVRSGLGWFTKSLKGFGIEEVQGRPVAVGHVSGKRSFRVVVGVKYLAHIGWQQVEQVGLS